MAENKKIKISSSFNVEAESLHEVIRDQDTGEAKFIDKEVPHKQTTSTTITTNPVKYEAKGIEEPKVKEGASAQVEPGLVGYDTSQL